MLLPLINLLIKVFSVSAHPDGQSVNFVLAKEEVFYEKHGDQCTDFEFSEVISQDEWFKRPNYIQALTAESKIADYTIKNRTEYCETLKTCKECTLDSTFQCVWCHDFGCAFHNNKKCTNHETKFCPAIKHKGIVLIPAGLNTEISFRLMISDPGLIANKYLYCVIVMPNNEKSVPASYSNGKVTCGKHVFDKKVECGFVKVFWGGYQPYSNKLDVFKYRCNAMATDPTSCSTIAERYECEWCLASGDCTIRYDCNKFRISAVEATTKSPVKENLVSVDTSLDKYYDFDYDTNPAFTPHYKLQERLNIKPTSLSPPLRTNHTTRKPEMSIQQMRGRIIYKNLPKKLLNSAAMEPEVATIEEIISPINCTLTDLLPFLKAKGLVSEMVPNQDKAADIKNNQLRNSSSCISNVISTFLTHKNKDAKLIKILRDVKRLLIAEQNPNLNTRRSIRFNLKKQIKGKIKEIDKILRESKVEERNSERKLKFL